jgi:NDP-sugar pyrophosphorylase family protein
MLPVGGKPMVEEVIDQFIAQGFTDFVLTTHYKADLIENYLWDGSAKGCKINYIREQTPQGTAGALRDVKAMGPIIVCNCDVQATVDYGDLLTHHAECKADATVCVALHQAQIPFGIVDTVNGLISGIEEKPIKNYPVVAGIYVLEPWVYDDIPDGPYNMPELIDQASSAVPYYLSGHWADIGTFEAYAGANA